ncbi:hypothetical protein BC332_15851 [Capsicum chinense]|nr:hypothetical protein BC332_15851 [Capsicum chinense]
MPTEEIVLIEVKAALAVCNIKTIIESRVGCSTDSMHLFLPKQKLQDLKTLYQCDIIKESVLQVKRTTTKASSESTTLRTHAQARVDQECEGHASNEAKNTSSCAKTCV